MSEISQSTPVVYRTAVSAADVLAAPATTAPSAVAGGSMPDGAYHAKAVGVNAYGRTGPSTDRTASTSGSNNTVRLPIAQLVGSTNYDIYVSTDADPKFVGRISEAQRATGCVITAVNVIGAGGIAGAVDVQIPGTGLQALTTQAENTAYVIPASPIDGSNNRYCYFDIYASRSGDLAALTVTVVPFVLNSRTSTYQQVNAPITLTFGGATGVLTPLKQRIQVEIRGSSGVALVIAKISGTGASIDIDASLT